MARSIDEEIVHDAPPLRVHPEWRLRFPWLVQGVAGGRTEAGEWDFGIWGTNPSGAVLGRWEALRREVGATSVIHAHQVHGADVWWHGDAPPPGVTLMRGVDGHLTAAPGILLTVTVADCVPVYLVDARTRTVAVVHSGWRGTAAGITERALDRIAVEAGGTGDVWIHCGPAICGSCYEAGPEVHAGVLPDTPPPSAPTPIDLRAAIVARATAAGVPAEQITTSAACTLCGSGSYFSHRGGSGGRQVGFIGIRGADPTRT